MSVSDTVSASMRNLEGKGKPGRPPTAPAKQSRAIRVGYATVVWDARHQFWVLPGGIVADNEPAAHRAATLMDEDMRRAGGDKPI